MKLPIFAFLIIFLWSSAFIGVRYTVQVIDPYELSFLRLIFASLTLGFIATYHGFKRIGLKELTLLALSGILGATFYFSFLNLGLKTVNAAEACVLINTIPLFTALFSWGFLKKATHN